VVPQQPKKEKGAMGHFLDVIREAIAAMFWVYVFLKLFIFDIDIFLANRFFPNYVWLLNFKFFILIGTVAVIWLITKNKHILFWLFYIFFYPAIILLWKLPFFVFKQKSWIFAFAVINAVISFFKSIKYNFITGAFFLVSLAIIFGFSNEKYCGRRSCYCLLSSQQFIFIDLFSFLSHRVYSKYTSRFFLASENMEYLLLR